MSPVCAFCGESFPRGRRACPHCGSDAETGWKDDDSAMDLPEDMDDDAYADFLADEGLSPRRAGRSGRPGGLSVLLALLAAAAIAGLFLLLR